MGIKLNAENGGGSVELDVPNTVNSDLALTVPATAGEIVVKDSSGNVGIGTSSPQQLLHLSSGGFPTMRVTDADNNTYCDITNSDGDIILKADEGNAFADSAIRFMVDSVEWMRLRSDSVLSINGVDQHFARGSTAGNSSLSRDFVVGASQTAVVFAGFNHYGLVSTHGCARIEFAGTGNNYSSVTVINHNTTNSGSWTVSKPSNDTLRVTKNAGSYSGSGGWFIHVVSS